MNWFRKLFARPGFETKAAPKTKSTLLGVVMPPIDNPLEYREDGSIRQGDPAWDFMMSVMDSGKSTIAVQSDDGSWTGEQLEDDLENTQPTSREPRDD